MLKRHCLAIIVAAFGALDVAQAADWNEFTAQGDLSSDRLLPSQLQLDPGFNWITGAMGVVAGTLDRDYLTVVVPTGYRLSGLRYGVDTRLSDGRYFLGLQSGTQMTVEPNAADASGLLGWAHVELGTAVGADLLPTVGAGYGATGFSAPLSAGNYTFWIQQTGNNSDVFHLGLQVTAVPEPSVVALFGSGFLLVYRRKRNQAKPLG